MAERTIERTFSATETEELGKRIGGGLVAGDIVLVEGELGTGKTTLIRGACHALGVTDRVTSPTFTIGQRYAGPVPVSHLDLYRLGELSAEEPGLLEDYLTADAVSFIEWPAAGGPELADAIVRVRVGLRHLGGDQREVEISKYSRRMSRGGFT